MRIRSDGGWGKWRVAFFFFLADAGVAPSPFAWVLAISSRVRVRFRLTARFRFRFRLSSRMEEASGESGVASSTARPLWMMSERASTKLGLGLGWRVESGLGLDGQAVLQES